MAHFAKVNADNIVINVIVADPEFFDSFIDSTPGKWIQTSYNTRGGIHYKPNSDEPSDDQTKALRKNFAGIGYTYNEQLDAFIPPKPFNSYVLNEQSCTWESPVPIPSSNEDGKTWVWDEATQNWV